VQSDAVGMQDLGRAGSADMQADGSGQYTVPRQGRVDGWDMARGVLTSQTGHEPSMNEIGNYLLEAKRLNPHVNFNRALKPGSIIGLPSITRQGDDTTFGAERNAADQQHTKLQQDNTEAKDKRTEADKVKQSYDAYAKWYKSLMGTDLPGLEQKSFDAILAPGGNPLPPDAKQGLEYLRDHWDKIQDMTGMVGGTRALTPQSIQAGTQARDTRVAATQAAFDREQAQANNQTIIPQSQWAAEHPDTANEAVVRTEEERVATPPIRRTDAPVEEGDPDLRPGSTAPMKPNRVKTIPVGPLNLPGRTEQREGVPLPPRVADREPPVDTRTQDRPDTVLANPQLRTDIGQRPPGLSDADWESLKTAKVLSTWHNVQGTGYQPVAGQGGPLDQAKRWVHTLEDVRNGKTPFVTLAFDSSQNIPYGQVVYIKNLGIYGMAGDNGGHFNGRTGQSAVDIAARGYGLATSDRLNASDLELQFLDARAPYEPPVQTAARHHRRASRAWAFR